MKLLKRILFVVLILVVLSNAFVHYNEIERLLTVEQRLTVEVTKTDFIFDKILNLFDIQYRINRHLYDKVDEISKRQLNLATITKPDFEKLMDGTVTIYNRGYMVAGVCIDEDEDWYYILTVYHLFSEQNDGTFYLGSLIPESSMGLAIKLNVIYLFLENEKFQEQIERTLITETTVQLRDYTMVAGEFLYVNRIFDLGLVRISKQEGMELEVLKLSEEYPKVGDEIYVLGHPLERTYNLSKGIVSYLEKPIYMGVDALITYGNSGGAVFNNRGEIVGIVSKVPVYTIE